MQHYTKNIAMLSIHSSPIGELGTRNTGGMSVYVRELARHLGRNGHRVDLYTQKTNSGTQEFVPLYENVRLIHLKNGNGRTLHKDSLFPHLNGFFGKLEKFRIGQALRYDLIHSHYWLSGWLGHLASQDWGCPHLITFHTLGALKQTTGVGAKEPGLRIETERKLIGASDRILSSTQRDRELLLRHYSARPEKVGVVHCGVNPEIFHPVDRSAARKAIGVSPKASMVLFVGRFDPLKGIDRLLHAMVHVKRVKQPVLVLIGGDGRRTPEHERLSRLARSLGIDDIVQFRGRVDQPGLVPYYNAADVLVLPSHYESFGLVALEALACGTPVVATPVGAMPDIIREGKNGIVTHDGMPESLAAGIVATLDRLDRHEIAAEEVRRSVLKYSWAKSASAVSKEYRSAIEFKRNHQEN